MLDLDLLHTLRVAVDLGGFAPAADRLGRTPSAISLQMKRLQQAVGAPLFRKEGRGLAPTEAGVVVLRYARRMLALRDELLDTVRGAAAVGSVRLGCTQDFAESVLPVVLSRFAELYPLVQMEVRIEGNAALAEAVGKGDLDMALTVGQAQRPTAEVIGEVPLVWIAGEAFGRRDGPLPLVMLGPQCIFRQSALSSLDAARIPWRIAATSPSLAGLWASARGNLGVTARSGLGVPAGMIASTRLFDLPPLGRLAVSLHRRPGDHGEASARLAALLGDAAAHALRGVSGAVRPPTQKGRPLAEPPLMNLRSGR